MKLLLQLLLLVFLGLGCELLDQKEAEPAYVVVNEVNVKAPSGNNYITHDIRDVWVYLDGKSLGIYPYPSHIPCLLEKEESELYFIPGIRDNGIASEVTIYPLLAHKYYNQTFVPGETYEINPVFEYRNNVAVSFEEGFEHTGQIFTFDTDENEHTKLQKSSLDAATGNHAGLFTVNDTLIYSEAATSAVFNDIPTNGEAVYLELDYKAEGDLYIGLIGYYDLQAGSDELVSYYLGLKPTDEWKKIYVNLTSEFQLSDLPAYRIIIRAEYTGSGNEERIFIDNVKLLHF